MAKKKKYYVVWSGRQNGVFYSWDECKKQINAYEGAKYKSFEDLAKAKKAFEEGYQNYWGKNKKEKKVLTKEELVLYGTPIENALCVDAACSGNPGKMEYQGVWTVGTELFHAGPFEQATVNIGEFLAIVHGLAWLKKEGLHDTPIYSDSVTAMKWINTKKINTKLKPNKKNEKVFELMNRALIWLNKNTYNNPIYKWHTKAWGEIPADFGRK